MEFLAQVLSSSIPLGRKPWVYGLQTEYLYFWRQCQGHWKCRFNYLRISNEIYDWFSLYRIFLCLCSSSFPEATKKLIHDGQKGMSLWDGSSSNLYPCYNLGKWWEGTGQDEERIMIFSLSKVNKGQQKKKVFFPLLVLFWFGHRNLAEVSWKHWLPESWWQKLFLWNWGRSRY